MVLTIYNFLEINSTEPTPTPLAPISNPHRVEMAPTELSNISIEINNEVSTILKALNELGGDNDGDQAKGGKTRASKNPIEMKVESLCKQVKALGNS